MSSLDTEVVIIGAGTCIPFPIQADRLTALGSTGLLLAQGLREAGISFRIFERHAADYVSREWSMSLHWGGEFLSEVLPKQLVARLHEINVDPNYDFAAEKGYTMCNGATGDVLLVMPGTVPRRVSRRRLKALLSEGIDIEYGKACNGFEISGDGVRIVFLDGTTISARVLIGADGSRSGLRRQMINDARLSEQTETPYTLINFAYTYPPETAAQIRAIHPVMKVAYHPTLNMMYLSSLLSAPDAHGNVTYQNLISWKDAPYPEDLQDQAKLLARFKDIGSQFAAPYRAAALGVSDDFRGVFVDRGTQWNPIPVFTFDGKRSLWNGNHYGRVTLAGDAAHPMLPHRGQALNHAFEDASRLLQALKSSLRDAQQPVAAALAEYESEMVTRTGTEVEVTSKAAAAAHNWEMFMQSPIFKHGANKS